MTTQGAAAATTCSGNYVPPGQRGHGSITYADDRLIGWTVVDYIENEETGCVNVVCRNGVAPLAGREDVDFFESEGVMYKLISGDVAVENDGFEVTPKRAVRMKIFSTASAFQVNKTPLLYRLNHWRENKQHNRRAALPENYLRHLKDHNETCAGLPLESNAGS